MSLGSNDAWRINNGEDDSTSNFAEHELLDRVGERGLSKQLLDLQLNKGLLFLWVARRWRGGANLCDLDGSRPRSGRFFSSAK